MARIELIGLVGLLTCVFVSACNPTGKSFQSRPDHHEQSESNLRPEKKSQVSSCVPRQGDSSDDIYCICNEQDCDEGFQFQWPRRPEDSLLVLSTMKGLRFNQKLLSEFGSGFEKCSEEDGQCDVSVIKVKLDERRQKIIGWGGGFTDSAGQNIFNLSGTLSNKLLAFYFGEEGLQYNMGRVPLGGTDYSPRPYSYNDVNFDDFEQSNWSLALEDMRYKIRAIKKAQHLVKTTGEEELKLVWSPWSAPGWMKSSYSLVGGRLHHSAQMYNSYVKYIMKFCDAYAESGIRFWGATVQNEPVVSSLADMNGMVWEKHHMVEFIESYLGPALEARGMGRRNFKLMVGDDTIPGNECHVPAILNSTALKYVSGVAFHWYFSNHTNYGRLSEIFLSYQDSLEFMLQTEACILKTGDKAVNLGRWRDAEAYAKDIIYDLLNWSAGWIDWNMALDMTGGQAWNKNQVDSPVIVNADANEFYKQPTYYALGHFSRFFRPGSRLLSLEASTQELPAVAVIKEDSNHVVVNILNEGSSRRRLVIELQRHNRPARIAMRHALVAEPRSISSVIIKLDR